MGRKGEVSEQLGVKPSALAKRRRILGQGKNEGALKKNQILFVPE